MMKNNPNCFIVTGHPRTPRDQGSVESANKLVQRVMKSISSEHHLADLKVNWTRFLGQVMAVCNNHSGHRRYCVSNYEAVFGQKYHPMLKCSLAEMHEWQSISQRLWLSLDERLKKYVWENDIIDIEFEKNGLAATFDDDDEDDEEYERMHPPVELDDAAFPDITGSFDLDEDNADKVAYVHDAVKANAQEYKVAFVRETTASTDVTTTQVNILPQTFQGVVFNSVSLAAPKAAPPGPDSTMMGSLWSETTGGAVANKHPETFCVSEYSNFMLQEAWDNGNIAQKHSILSRQHKVEYKFLFTTLTCSECCFPHLKTLI
jgi:hypothetical protein